MAPGLAPYSEYYYSGYGADARVETKH
jgi:hypothetical protein